MMNSLCNVCGGHLKSMLTTYTGWHEQRPLIIQNVLAWVCQHCGEVYYDPDVVEKIQQIIWSHRPPVRVMETPVYDLEAT